MQVQDPIELLFLGENPAWSKLSESIAEDSGSSLHLHRLSSLSDLFRALANGRCHAVALDIHAWNFKGLHFVEKIRSKYPTLPILALYSPSLPNIDSKALTNGASHCISLDDISADTLHVAVASSLAETYSKPFFRRTSSMQLGTSSNISSISATGSGYPSSKNQLLTHALNNLLCVISANADLLEEFLDPSGPGSHSLAEIKKAAASAAALMRSIK